MRQLSFHLALGEAEIGRDILAAAIVTKTQALILILGAIGRSRSAAI